MSCPVVLQQREVKGERERERSDCRSSLAPAGKQATTTKFETSPHSGRPASCCASSAAARQLLQAVAAVLLRSMTNTRTAQRLLWKSATSGAHQEEEEESLDRIRQHYTVRPVPRTLFRLCAQAVVVVQEFALTCFLLSRHEITTQQGELLRYQQYVEIATAVLFLALLSAVYYGARADPSRQQDRRSKIRQRSVDAVLLALLLRWVAGTLQSLTASYSSDTVQALALAGMVVHLLFCDYSYANGRRRRIGGESSSSSTPQPPARPPFQGGTVSLNAALFSTTLLVSRLPSSSRLSAYLFVSLAIVIFALYPATRHAISVTYPAVYSGAYSEAS